jgi:hypothetical protein
MAGRRVRLRRRPICLWRADHNNADHNNADQKKGNRRRRGGKTSPTGKPARAELATKPSRRRIDLKAASRS